LPKARPPFRSIILTSGLLGDPIARRFGTSFNFIKRGVAKTFAAQQTSADADRTAEVKARLAAEE
jgi:hypothetical protein